MPTSAPHHDAAGSGLLPHCTTLEAARRLGMAVRSVQMMVDRGELEAWKTPGGHRRISEASLERWVARRRFAATPTTAGRATEPADAIGNAVPGPAAVPAQEAQPRVLLIEDSIHHQTLVSMLVSQRFPGVELHIAGDGVSGLAMYGRLRPDVLIVDILLPGIDGATLITSLRSNPLFAGSRLIVLTSLDESQRVPYEMALGGVPVVHKPRLVLDLPALIERCLASQPKTPA